MTDKDVQKLSRKDLVEILYYLSRENDELREENDQLKARLDALVGEALSVKKTAEAETAEAEKTEETEETAESTDVQESAPEGTPDEPEAS